MAKESFIVQINPGIEVPPKIISELGKWSALVLFFKNIPNYIGF